MHTTATHYAITWTLTDRWTDRHAHMPSTHCQFVLVGYEEGQVSCDGTVEEVQQCSWSIELPLEVHQEDKLMPTVLSSTHGGILNKIDDARTQSKGLQTKRSEHGMNTAQSTQPWLDDDDCSH